MYCSGCGVALIEGAAFCHGCGVPKGSAVNRPPQQGAQWEFCEIHAVVRKTGGKYFLDNGFKAWFSFVAYKHGPGKVKVEVAKTSEIKGSCGPDSEGYTTILETHAATNGLRDIVAELTANGWHYTNDGPKWYSNKFKKIAS